MSTLATFSPTRKFHRYPVDLVAVRTGACPRLDRVENLCRAGARLSTHAAPPAGSQCTYLLVFPGGESRSVIVPIKAVVAWSTGFDAGLSFRDLNQTIDGYLQRVMSPLIPSAAFPGAAR